jgi:hypothetical protein
MSDIVETVRQGIRKFEHETACGIIAVETLAVHREVLIKLCDEIEALRKPWVGFTDEEREKATGWSVEHIETELKEKNT